MKKVRLRVLRSLRLRTYIAIGLLLVLSPIVLFSLFKPNKTEAVWMNDSWAYRTSLTFTHNASVSTATKVKFDIDTSTLITAGKMQSDCGDSRFTDLNGKVLPYYIDSVGGACNTNSTDYYVLIPTIINGTNVIYHYYGNQSAADGTVSAQFSQSTTTPSGGAASSGSEEKGTGPVAYWNFDEGYGTTTSDSSQNRNTATLSNMSSTPDPTSGWVTDYRCIKGNCLAFDGTDDSATASTNSSFKVQSHTLSAWIKPRSTNAHMIIASYSNNISSSGVEWSINNGQLAFAYNDGSVRGWYTDTGAAIPLARWSFVSISWNQSAGQVSFYVNGTLQSTISTTTGTISYGSETFRIGNQPSGNDYFKGTMDEVKLYNYNQSATQIKALYNSSAASDDVAVLVGKDLRTLSDGLVGYWNFDETSAWATNCLTASIIDQSGNGNNTEPCPNGSAATQTGAGRFGKAINFDDTNDYTNGFATNFPQIGTPVTESVWYKLSATPVSDKIGFMYITSGSGTINFHTFNGNVIVSDSQNAITFNTASAGTNTVWHHAVYTYDGTTNNLYIDGTLQNSTTTAHTGSGSIQDSVKFGSPDDASGKSFQLDDIRIYKRALSAQEVKYLYNWAPGPVGYWNFDEKSTSTVYDKSGNGNNATIQGSAPIVAGKYGPGIGASVNNVVERAVVSDPSSGILDFSNTQDFTTELWVKLDSKEGSLIIPLTKSYYTQIDTSDQRCNYDTDGLLAGSTIMDNQWHHVTCVMDRDGYETGIVGLSLYVDGIYKGSDTTLTGSDQSGSTATLNFGDNDSAQEGVTGIDEVKIYNYARSPSQIVEDMNGSHPIGGSPVGSYTSYWRMDEGSGTTANDYNSTNGNSLTLSTSSWDTAGKTNYAWKGVGTNWLSRADDDDFDISATDNASISMWFKSTSATNPAATEYLFAKGRGTPPGYALYLNTSGFLCWSIDDDASWTPDDTACTTTDVYDGTWHHVVAQKTGTTEIRLYLDGSSKAADTSIAATGTLANSGTLYVGDDDGDATNSFNGDIDEVKFYRSTLTIDQIALDMNAGSAINFGSTASTEASTLSDGAGSAPVGYWNFDEKTGTTASNRGSQAGTGDMSLKYCNGGGVATTSNWVGGKLGSSILFNASGDAASTAYTVSTYQSWMAPTSFSVSFWMNPSSVSQTKYLVSRWFDTNDRVWGIKQNNTNIQIRLSPDGTAGNEQALTGTSAPLVANTWQHIEVVYTNGTGFQVYVNGVLKETLSYVGSLFASTRSLAIAADQGCNSTFSGEIDEVKFYNYARTQGQVAYDYNRGAPIGYWRLDDCQGPTANDSSGNGYNGTLSIGATGTQTSAGTCTSSSTAWGNGSSGKFNSSLNFDGTDDYIACTDASCGGTSKLDFGVSVPFSYGGWINTSSAASKIILSKKDGTTSGSAGYLLQLSANNFAVCRISDGTTQVSPTDTVALNDSAWHHIMCVHTGSALNLYVDGKLRVTSSTASVTGTLDNASDFRIGTSGTPSSNYFGGQIDDVRVYNYALSVQQIRTLYEGGTSVYFGPSSGQP